MRGKAVRLSLFFRANLQCTDNVVGGFEKYFYYSKLVRSEIKASFEFQFFQIFPHYISVGIA